MWQVTQYRSRTARGGAPSGGPCGRTPAGAADSRDLDEIAVGLPLQELEKLDPPSVRGDELGDRRRFGVGHRRWPGLPRKRRAGLGEMLVQRLEGGKRRQRVAAVADEYAEGRAERAAPTALAGVKAPVERIEHRALQRGDRGVIHELGAARRRDHIARRQRPGGGVLGQARDLGPVEVERGEPGPARWDF